MVLCNNKPYTYDAAGNKLKKVTVDNTISPSKTTTTLYIGGAVYENDVMQFMAHEEGRIRPVRDANMTFRPFSFEMKWNRWEYHNQNQAPCKNLF